MPKYIDADAVIEELRQIYNDCDDWENHISQSDLAESEKRILTNRASATKAAMVEVRLRVDKMPSADVVAVVRCRDCKWNGDDCTWCMNPNLALGGDYTSCLYIEPNWFCADGERKEKSDAEIH
jgi:hypothetical protein